jgi:hypothetical protein
VQVIEQRDDFFSRPLALNSELCASLGELVAKFGRFFVILFFFLVAFLLNLRQLGDLLL